MTIDAKLLPRIRREFPVLAKDATGHARVFLDNGAGTLVNRRAADREARARIAWSANTGNPFPESKGAEATIVEGRQAVADFLHAGTSQAIISGESATGLLFHLSYAIGRTLTGNEKIVTTAYEHHANVGPWAELVKTRRAREVRYADFNLDTGYLDLQLFSDLVDQHTKVVTVTAASNFLGTHSDLEELGKIAHDAGALFVVDAVHDVCHRPTDVQDIGADALVFSGYKLFSRHGSFLYLRPELIESLTPYKVDPAPNHGPERWEWGTRDQAMLAAIAGVVDYLSWLGAPTAKTPAKPGSPRLARVRKAMEAVEAYEAGISRLLLEGDGKWPGLLDIPGLTLYGPKEVPKGIGRDPTFSFKLAGYEDQPLSRILYERYGLAVGAEDYFSCVPAIYGIETAMRATFVHYNTKGDASTLLRALNELAAKKR